MRRSKRLIVNEELVAEVKKAMRIERPVHLRTVLTVKGGPQAAGGYLMDKNGEHNIEILGTLPPYTAGSALLHELRHAQQAEAFVKAKDGYEWTRVYGYDLETSCPNPECTGRGCFVAYERSRFEQDARHFQRKHRRLWKRLFRHVR